MERQARFLRMGMLVLAFAAAVLASIYWLHGVANLGATAVYVVRFDGAAPGVEVGSSVLFDGVRVGEVTKIAFDPRDPNEVFATIRISRTTPVRADTRVGVDTLGPMGGGLISLHGGGAASPPPSGVGGATPVLTADPALVVGLGETARAVLQRVDKLVAEDSDPLHSTLSNLEVFSDALSRNSGRVDSILQGLERMTAGGPPKSSTPMYDLAAPTSFPPFKKLLASLVVAEPTAIVMYDSQRVLRQAKDGGFAPLDDAQWSDSLLKLVQAKLLEAYENAELFASVGRPVDGAAPETQLLVDVRRFGISASPSSTAEIVLAARLLSADGKIVAEREFHRTEPVATNSAAAAVSALNGAFVDVETDLVAWTSESL
jgi:phospholipid/cholesterol/gamma-HCH transport system substrate-binding protein